MQAVEEGLSLSIALPGRLLSACRDTSERKEWLRRLPHMVRTLEARWTLTLGKPFEDASCAWVAPARLSNGSFAVLKIGMPHMEGEQEAEGLRFWNGQPTVHLIDADMAMGAMLLEFCDPGTSLRTLQEPEQDFVIAGLLRSLWRRPTAPHSFRPLLAMTTYWTSETMLAVDLWKDSGLVHAGLELFRELARTTIDDVLLATDLHAGNVLRSKREPWLIIDPKPFLGDPAYDVTQHLFNSQERLRCDPEGTIKRLSDLLEVESRRVKLWTFARAAAEPRQDWNDELSAFAGSMKL